MVAARWRRRSGRTMQVRTPWLLSRRTSSRLVRKHRLPILLHVDDGPTLYHRLVERLIELADFGIPIVGVFARRIGMVDEAGEAQPLSRHGPLQHLKIAVGIAERED